MTEEDGQSKAGLIEIRLRELSQLFNSLDPSPFHERELDDGADAYIVDWARELPQAIPLRLVIHLPGDEARKAQERGLAMALSNHFGGRAETIERDRRELLRMGWRYLAIGLLVLLFCLAASQLARAMLGKGPVARWLEEGLIIVGWVANWKPIETFLYDWWPLYRRRNLYRRLADARVEIVPIG